MEIQQRLTNFITRANWVLFALTSMLGLVLASPEFARGIIFGGLIVTVNFHMLSRTINKALTPPVKASHNSMLIKYYLRFVISGFILYLLVSNHYVNPLGLFVGISIVVASILVATMFEIKKTIVKEAV